MRRIVSTPRWLGVSRSKLNMRESPSPSSLTWDFIQARANAKHQLLPRKYTSLSIKRTMRSFVIPQHEWALTSKAHPAGNDERYAGIVLMITLSPLPSSTPQKRGAAPLRATSVYLLYNRHVFQLRREAAGTQVIKPVSSCLLDMKTAPLTWSWNRAG